jgi:WD40 repeat protein/energy-coupling factor transporter ATP-binding protein EcfA2
MHINTINRVSNPFPGLRPFKIEESHLFFGREGQCDEVLLKLSKNKFIGIIGPSGSGKSSFIYCGVIPILYGGFLSDKSTNWQVLVTRPGISPIDNLAEAILQSTQANQPISEENKRIKKTIYSTLLRSSSLGLVEAIEQIRKNSDTNYLILVDQFEELFRLKGANNASASNDGLAFVNLLLESVRSDKPIYVAITMRSDFIGECAQYPELTRKINDSNYLIPQLTREQKRKAIEGPVAVGGGQISPRLTQQLLNDLGDNPDQLPILQHALMRTWSYWTNFRDQTSEPLDLKHYEAIGTMSEALSQHANEAYDELDERQKVICEYLFKTITEKRGENYGIRRPTRLKEIAAIANASEEEVIAVIDRFREPSRSLLTPAHHVTITSQTIIDISHESLMRIWIRLKKWVNDEADAVQMYMRLAEAASMHQVGKAGLWRPPDLQLALNWNTKHKPTLVWGQRYHHAYERTMTFLDYSRIAFEEEQRAKEREQKLKLKKARNAALILGTGIILCLLLLVYAFMMQAEAEAQRILAQEEKKEADAQRTLAEQNAEAAREAEKIADEKRLEAERATRAAIEAKEAEEQQRAQAEKARMEAIRNAELAKQNANEAKLNAERALANEKIANEQKLIAVRNAEEALRQRYIAQAKAMAVKSRELNDPEQEALIAQQAYNFNITHKGYVHDNDIYNGLYAALKKIDHPLTLSLVAHERGAARDLVTRVETNTIYSVGSDGRIIQWKETNNQWKSEILVSKKNYQYYSIDISPDGKWIAVGGLATIEKVNYVELYDLQDLKKVKRIEGFSVNIEDISFTPDSKGFYARDNAGRSIKFSDLTSVKEIIKPSTKINAITLHPNGTALAGAGDDGSVYLWDIQNQYAEQEIKHVGDHVMSIAFSPNGEKIILGDNTGVVKIINPTNHTIEHTLTGHSSSIEKIQFNHQRSFMATASKDKTVRLWNTSRWQEQPIILSDHRDWIWGVTFTPDDQQLMACIQSSTETVKGIEHTIRTWPTQTKMMSDILCEHVSRNISKQEWEIFVGEDLPYELTCTAYPANDN